MRIATFGDLHLGHTPVLDKFLGEEDRLLRLDDHLSRTHDRIILMGDIYQTDYGRYPGSRSDVLEAILKRYSRIVRRWSTAHHYSLFGNHDLITQKLLGNLKQIRLLKDDWRIWLTHGHQFDPFIGDKRRLPFVVTWMIGRLRRLGFSCLADLLEGRFYNWGQRVSKALETAAIIALDHGINNVIIMGHSHQMACLPIGRGVYVNSGACVPDSLRYVSIDTSRRVVEVRSFTPPNGTQLFLRWQEGVPSFVKNFIRGSIDPWGQKEAFAALLTPSADAPFIPVHRAASGLARVAYPIARRRKVRMLDHIDVKIQEEARGIDRNLLDI